MKKVSLRKFYKAEHSSWLHSEVLVNGYLEPSSQYLNWSDIRDKLIRLAAKYTDYYASDLLYGINEIQEHLDSKIYMPEYFFAFRENGVDSAHSLQNCTENELELRFRAIWRITANKIEHDGIEMSLHKVNYNPYRKGDKNESSQRLVREASKM